MTSSLVIFVASGAIELAKFCWVKEGLTAKVFPLASNCLED